jgi:hypothetical protein
MTPNQPYKYLNFPKYPLLPGWQEKIKDLNSVFVYFDLGATFLIPEIKDIFLSKDLIPSRGNIWSWAPDSVPKFYHTDQKETETTTCELCAINWLISGNPGKTEWSFKALNDKIDDSNKMVFYPNVHKTQPQLWRASGPDFVAELTQPMAIRTNVPHRVNNLSSDTWRIAYSVRFKGNPTWETVLEKLQDYLV